MKSYTIAMMIFILSTAVVFASDSSNSTIEKDIERARNGVAYARTIAESAQLGMNRYQIIHLEGPVAIKLDTFTGQTWRFYIVCSAGSNAPCWSEIPTYNAEGR